MKISDITAVVTGGTPSTKNSAYWENGSIPWLQSGVCKNGYVDVCSKYITQAGLDKSSAKMMPAGTVIIALTGATVGKVGLLRIDACANQSVTGIIPCESFLPLYVFYYLMSIRGEIIHDSYGDAQPHISQQYVKDIDIPLPSLPEQERVVARIEELFSQLDAGVETLKKTKEQLAVYRRAVLKEAFSFGKCDVTVEIKEIADDIRIGPFGSILHKEDYVCGGIPVINPQHIKGNKIIPNDNITVSDQKAAELSAYMLKENDIIMARRGEMGRTAPVSKQEEGWICGTGSIIFRLKPNFNSALYAKILSSPDAIRYLEEHATGTTMKNLNEKIVSHIPVPYITKDMEDKVLLRLDSQKTVCDNIEITVDQALQRAEAMRQSILKQAFEGRL